MGVNERFVAIRKGLLEFLVLKIVAANKVYVADILRGLEQAIADRCQRFLGPHKAIVTEAEVAQIVAELGPVTSGPETNGAGEKNANGTKQTGGGASGAATPKRLYRLSEGAMLAGVCNGLAV